ncbi:MAG: hypothetical protein K6B67_04980 [Lachnospiraceae bacterium]|nr:hypothetical protein [Lachnospiraceae bacterium]
MPREAQQEYEDIRSESQSGFNLTEYVFYCDPSSQNQINLMMDHINSYDRPELGDKSPYELNFIPKSYILILVGKYKIFYLPFFILKELLKMSQAKVDLNKEKKLNRKKEVKQRKVKHVLGILCTCLVCGVIIGWISFSVYQKQQDKALANPDTVTLDSTAITDYLNGISGI